MQPMIRSFIAIQLTQEVHSKLREFSKGFTLVRQNGFRPVQPENIHLTLKFLGDATPIQIEDVKKALKEITVYAQPFKINLRGVGAFPGWERPKIIWVGIDSPRQLEALFQQIDAATVKIGFPSEGRGFSPHLTLARISTSPVAPQAIPILQALRKLTPPPHFGEIQVNSVILFRSVLQPAGPVYTPLSIHPFTGWFFLW